MVSRHAALVVAVILISGFIGGFAAARAQNAKIGTANLAGRVVDQQDGRSPLARVRVLLYVSPASGPEPVRETLTDTDGRYSFPQLPAGTYEIHARMPGWLTARYGQKKPDRPGTPVAVAERESLKDLTIRMFRGGVITGFVRGQNGQPLIRWDVEVFRMRYSQDGRYLESISETTTDDRGQYRVFDLSPAEYVVRVSPGSTTIPPASRSGVEGIQPPPADGHPTTFFPAALTPGQAAAIALGPAEERAGVDFSLPVTPFSSIRGRFIGPNGPVTNVQLRRLDDDGLMRGDESLAYSNNPDGQFVINNLPPGPISILARQYPERRSGSGSGSALDGTLWGVTRLVVGGGAATDVTIGLQPGALISGAIKLDGAAAPLDYAKGRIDIALQPAGPTGLTEGEVLAGVVGPDGRFGIGGVPPGLYHLITMNVPSPWAFVSATRDGRDITATAFEVTTENQSGVVMTFSDRPASLSGSLQAPDGTVATDYTVIAFPADPASRAQRSRAVYAVRANTAGRFSMARVFPGEYLMVVTDDIEPNSWFDPRVLEQLAPAAIRVTVAPGEAKAQTLRIGR